MKKELEFKITGNKILNIADFDWHIKDINAIYISKTNNANWLYPELGIYIETDFDTVELYYKTTDEIKISNAYKSLVTAISNVDQNFKIFFPVCLNINNVKHIKTKKMAVVGYEAILTFNENEHKIVASKKRIEELICEHNQLHENLEL